MSDLLLSRTLDVADYDRLAEELKVVDSYPNGMPHPHRRWEYALALHAIWRWQQRDGFYDMGAPIYDVGGAGSHFHHMVGQWAERSVEVLDPAINKPLDAWVVPGTALADVVTCISVIEHVPDLERFLYHLSCLVAPGGLLVLTMDFWSRCGPDTATHHDVRQRIFCPKTYAQLRNLATSYHLTAFGGVDPTYHGAQVWDYTFASLVLEKAR